MERTVCTAVNFAPAMPEQGMRSSKPIATWLLVGVGMLIIQVLLGGITRLTGSGLSITEWDVVTGALPPLNQEQWLAAFEKYKHTPQFQLLNFDFTLSDFKFIFFWEWFHRFWARLIGVVFLIPFVVFLFQKRFRPSMVKPMLILFLLGALQGAVGWIMVASGLSGDAVYVAPVRLGLHLLLALVLVSYAFWFYLELALPPGSRTVGIPARRLTWLALSVLAIQLFYGALMAGYKAATAAPTWPDINGAVFPAQMFYGDGLSAFLFENRIAIHFIHRGLAYLLFLIILLLSFRLRLPATSSAVVRKIRWWPLLLVFVQIGLGIFAVLTSPGITPGRWQRFEWLAQIHQLTAMFLLLSLIAVLFLVRRKV